jgi:hypothetical protein
MSFTFYPGTPPATEIDPTTLQHRYFVRLAPDGSHLVPGLIQQDEKPRIGRWLELGKITRELPERYFVQYTDFNTLVLGSLIRGDRFPQGQWKEVKRPSFGEFNRFVFDPDWMVSIHNNHVSQEGFLQPSTFVDYYLMPVLEYIQPGFYSQSRPANVQLFYFQGTFEELDNDVPSLEVFGGVDRFFSLHSNLTNTDTSLLTTNTVWSGFESFVARPFADDGYYSLVVKVEANAATPAYYIVMENLFRRYEFNYS